MVEELIGAGDVAGLLHVTTERVRQIAATYPDFPKPRAVVSGRKAWRRRDIDAWISRHPTRTPGRPKRGAK